MAKDRFGYDPKAYRGGWLKGLFKKSKCPICKTPFHTARERDWHLARSHGGERR
jgi:hypothetical protein